MSDNLKTWPEKIWLQAGFDGETQEFPDGDEITWNCHEVENGDIEYHRFDLAQPVTPAVPVAVVFTADWGGPDIKPLVNWADLPIGTNLYTARAAHSPQPKALTDGQLDTTILQITRVMTRHDMRVFDLPEARQVIRNLIEGAK